MYSICVFSGSSPGARAEYVAAARKLGSVVAQRGFRLVYGGAGVGLMRVVADAALEAGGQVVGVLPRVLRAEVAHPGLTSLIEVDTMHQRKARMTAEADAFVALPGGYGTLDELFEALAWTQLGLHDKAVGLLNVGGYFDGLTGFLDHALAERFLHPAHRAMLQVATTPEALLSLLQDYEPPRVPKWVDRAEGSRVDGHAG